MQVERFQAGTRSNCKTANEGKIAPGVGSREIEQARADERQEGRQQSAICRWTTEIDANLRNCDASIHNPLHEPSRDL
jgi:hypothetical protein